MNPADIIRTARAAIWAAVVIVLVLANPAWAVDDGGPPGVRPITVYTDDPAARQPGGTAAQLLQRARERREIGVIVGLRTTMRMEHTLAPAEVSIQRQSLLRLQNAVAARVLGSGAAAERFRFIPYMSLYVDPAQLVRLLADPQVVSVQEDVPGFPALGDSLPLIHAPELFKKRINGTGQTVAVLDTGVDKTHPMLRGKVVSEACYSTNHVPSMKSSVCPGGVTDSTLPGSAVNCAVKDCDHGTHVASIAAGNSRILDGVARDSEIIAVQVFSRSDLPETCGSKPPPCIVFTFVDLIKGLERVYELRTDFTIAAVNMSLGGALFPADCDAASPGTTTIIGNLRAAGIAPVIASGNNKSAGSITIPACISMAIAVGNTSKTDVLAVSSNHSPLVKLLAPGTAIKAAVPGGAYGVKSGTSMAAPHVAGAFALLRDAKPAATVDAILEALTCTGKIVDRRTAAGGAVALDPPRPRIDLIAAYHQLLAPPVALRTWNFNKAEDALDWTPLHGTWRVRPTGDGLYIPDRVRGPVLSSVANCNTALTVTARMRRVDPTPMILSSAGLFFKMTVDHTARTISGYEFIYSKNGLGEVLKFTGRNLDTLACPVFLCTVEVVCDTEDLPVVVGGYNTLKIVSIGPKHTFSINGRRVCVYNDATYTLGPVMLFTGWPPAPFPFDGSFAVDYVTIRAQDAAAAADSYDPVMDPSAFTPKAFISNAGLAGLRPR